MSKLVFIVYYLRNIYFNKDKQIEKNILIFQNKKKLPYVIEEFLSLNIAKIAIRQ